MCKAYCLHRWFAADFNRSYHRSGDAGATIVATGLELMMQDWAWKMHASGKFGVVTSPRDVFSRCWVLVCLTTSAFANKVGADMT